MALWISQPPLFALSGRGRFAVLSRITVALVLASTILLAIPSSRAEVAAPAQSILSAAEANELAGSGAVTIIDIRRPDEWRATGIAAGAQRATIDYARGTGRFLDRIKKLTDGNKDKPIALICAAGVRSKHAAALLRRQGYTAVADISEGMTGSAQGIGWIKHGLPVSRCSAC